MMQPVTRGSEGSSHVRQSERIGVVAETLALFFVAVFLVAIILALATVLQNGFD